MLLVRCPQRQLGPLQGHTRVRVNLVNLLGFGIAMVERKLAAPLRKSSPELTDVRRPSLTVGGTVSGSEASD